MNMGDFEWMERTDLGFAAVIFCLGNGYAVGLGKLYALQIVGKNISNNVNC